MYRAVKTTFMVATPELGRNADTSRYDHVEIYHCAKTVWYMTEVNSLRKIRVRLLGIDGRVVFVTGLVEDRQVEPLSLPRLDACFNQAFAESRAGCRILGFVQVGFFYLLPGCLFEQTIVDRDQCDFARLQILLLTNRYTFREYSSTAHGFLQDRTILSTTFLCASSKWVYKPHKNDGASQDQGFPFTGPSTDSINGLAMSRTTTRAKDAILHDFETKPRESPYTNPNPPHMLRCASHMYMYLMRRRVLHQQSILLR